MIIRVTPRGMLNTFFRHRKKFALTFLPIFGLAAAYCFHAVPRYMSSAALLVKFGYGYQQSNGIPPTAIAAAQLERIQIINSQIGVMYSNDLLADALNTLKMERVNVYPELAGINDPVLKLDTALLSLYRDLDIEPAKNSNIITLTLLNPDAAVGAKVLNVLIDKFIAVQSKLYQTSQLPFMEEQLAQARRKLETSRTAVEAFKAATGISSLEEERTLLLHQQSDAQESLTQAASKQQDAQGRYQKLEQLLKTMPSDIKLSDQNDRFKAVDDARQRVGDLLIQQKLKSDNYRADSTAMKTLNAQLDFAQQQLATASKESAARVITGVNPVRQQAEIDLMNAAGDQNGATASRVSYEADLGRIGQKLSKLESQSQQLDALTLQQQVDEENFRNYLQAVNDARVTDDQNRQRISSIAVIQAPTEPATPSRPRTKLVLAAAFLVALVASITVVLLAEMLDESFSTADQIEAVLGLPVLGTFTMRRRMVRRQLPVYVKLLPLLILLVGMALPATVFGYDSLDPSYGIRLVIRDQSGSVTETLYPRNGEFQRVSAHGQQLGFAKWTGSTLTFYNVDGRSVSSAKRELLPANYRMDAIAVVRDASGNPLGVVGRY
jgi:polysaccharide biosynthesis protein PslE